MKPPKSVVAAVDVDHLSHLANIPLKSSQKKTISHDLADIIKYVNEVQSLNLKSVEPTAQVNRMFNHFREDVVKPSLTQAQALANAPRQSKGYFVVDRIIKDI